MTARGLTFDILSGCVGLTELVEGVPVLKYTSAPRSPTLDLPLTAKRPRPLRTGPVKGHRKTAMGPDQPGKTTSWTGSV